MSSSLTRASIEAAIEKVRTSTGYQPHVPLHHPRCDAVQPGAEAGTPCSTIGCAP